MRDGRRCSSSSTRIFGEGILALALAYPGWGPDRLSLELDREKWGGSKSRQTGSGGSSSATG